MAFSVKNKMDFNRKINDGFENFLVTFPCNLKSQWKLDHFTHFTTTAELFNGINLFFLLLAFQKE